MTIFTYGFATTTIGTTLAAMYHPPTRAQIPGLIQSECMANMKLGASVFSPERMQLNHLSMFAAWESHEAIDHFYSETQLGKKFATGWHVRMTFLRRWGRVKEFDWLPESEGESDAAWPVVAVTLARMKIPEVPRFIRWGKPVEELVRDHPGTTLASASMRLPRTVSTFSIWTTQKEMSEMVHGKSHVDRPERHSHAMKERDRKNFHFEFTTLRFKPISEHGTWQGCSNFVPSLM